MSHRKDVPEEGEDREHQQAAERIAEEDARIDELEAALAEANGERLRAIADFQNYRRRNEQEKQLFRQLATESLVTKLLPILDNFERSLSHLSDGSDPDAIAAGVAAIDRQLRSILEGYSLTRIEALGQPFDPELHEAIAIESSEEHAPDTVIAEIEPGYRIGEKVVRPARVKVAKAE